MDKLSSYVPSRENIDSLIATIELIKSLLPPMKDQFTLTVRQLELLFKPQPLGSPDQTDKVKELLEKINTDAMDIYKTSQLLTSCKDHLKLKIADFKQSTKKVPKNK